GGRGGGAAAARPPAAPGAVRPGGGNRSGPAGSRSTGRPPRPELEDEARAGPGSRMPWPWSRWPAGGSGGAPAAPLEGAPRGPAPPDARSRWRARPAPGGPAQSPGEPPRPSAQRASPPVPARRGARRWRRCRSGSPAGGLPRRERYFPAGEDASFGDEASLERSDRLAELAQAGLLAAPTLSGETRSGPFARQPESSGAPAAPE